jgi:hypothetical protein
MAFNRLTIWFLAAGLLLLSAAEPPAQDTPPTATAFVAPLATDTPSAPTLPPPWVSPTPDETGAITVIVQPGESMWVIAARARLTLPELLAMNNLTEADIISPGDVLLIGYATPTAPTTAPQLITPSATPPPPTPRVTPTPAEASICLVAFDDLDRDGLRDPGEPLRAGVAFTVYDTQSVVANHISDLTETNCLTLPPGEYRVTRSVLSNEVLTTAGDWALSVSPGSELHQAFGSFIGEAPAGTAVSQQPATGAPSPTAFIPVSPTLPAEDRDVPLSFVWRLAGVAVLFLGGLLLLGAVLILLFRGSRNQS